MIDYRIEDAELLAGSRHILSLANGVDLDADPLGTGAFLRFTCDDSRPRNVYRVGFVCDLTRFTACHRYEPFWMNAKSGDRETGVPIETQSLLGECSDGRCVLLIPIIDGAFRCSLQGSADGALELVSESGDSSIAGRTVVGLFVAAGEDPYELVEASARSVMARLRTGRLRTDKSLPAFVDQFGWCTWDAFYQDVSHDKVRDGLKTFKAGGVQPKLVILDDGWQSVRKLPSGEPRLTSFAPNGKFEGDLTPLTAMAKSEYGVETFLVWHAFHGYWGGVDADALPGYGVRSIRREFSPGIRSYGRGVEEYWGSEVGVVSCEHAYRFFQDYHRTLRLQGVDGVKVDSQATVEGVCQGDGGRVAAMLAYHEALDGSVHTHFEGNLINCMSCASEMLYGSLSSTVTRTSTDFWPNVAGSHGSHLYVNAQVSLWFGEFIHPDWDMFQSGHKMGAFHAAGRAVGGCPVYVSDKPGEHDFDLLRKLVLPTGDVLRCRRPGRPTRDCLFRDPTTEDVLLKIFNVNEHGGVVGVFHARYIADGSLPLAGGVRPSDVEGLAGDRFAVYAHNAAEMRVLDRGEEWQITLPQHACEVFTIIEIRDGFAPLGLVNMLNSGGAIIADTRTVVGEAQVRLRAGGRFAAYCEKAPAHVWYDGRPISFTYDIATRRLDVPVPGGRPCVVSIG